MNKPNDTSQEVWDAAMKLEEASIYESGPFLIAEAMMAEQKRILDLLVCHQLYLYRPKAFEGFIAYIQKGEA